MSTGEAGFVGEAPQVLVRTVAQTRADLGLDAETDSTVNTGDLIDPERGATPISEREKYMRMWAHPEYRVVAPGEHIAVEFLAQARPAKGATVIDFGAGTGRGALMLALMGGVQVELLDFADNCLDDEVRQALETQPHALRFTLQDLTKPIPKAAQYGFCTDVMEHIPPADVDVVLSNILKSAQHVFFQISCVDDVCGKLIGAPLHLSVHNYAWWAEKFRQFDCQIHYSQDRGDSCVFYLTAWLGGKELSKAGVLNVPEDSIVENVRTNVRGPWINIQPHEPNEIEVMILGGGPSLNGQIDKIRELRAAGVKLVTLNGTYNWALERDFKVSATVVVDAREFNQRFTHPVQPDTKYLISSQVHPAVLEGLPPDRTYLWHTQMETVKTVLNEEYGKKDVVWWSIFGGSTVMLRAIPLLRILGFRKFHLFGFDSCLSEEAHHAYAQSENDRDITISCTVGDRVFQCHPWMVSQAQEFMDMTNYLGDETQIEVYGDGLISHILNVGAAKADFLI
jgi:hypothetical protein